METSEIFHERFKLKLLLSCIANLLSIVSAFAPRTSQVENNFSADGWTPNPTGVPSVALELLKRDDSSICGYVGGYVSGMPAIPITCPGGASCLSESDLKLVGCCYGGGICRWATTCYDFRDMSSCVGACATDLYAAFCTEAASRYCVKLSYTDIGYSNFGCESINLGVVPAAFRVSTPPTSSPSLSSSSSSSTSPSSSPSPLSSPSPSPSPPSHGSSLGVPDIIGIVSAVCSVLGLVFGIAFKTWTHKKKKKKKKEQENNQEQQQTRSLSL